MPSAFATQLAQTASLNAAALSTSKRKPLTQSYLFTAKEASNQDLDSIFAIASNGFLQLRTVVPKLGDLEDALFSEKAKVTDRTLLSQDVAEVLNARISDALKLLGPHIMEAPTGKILEWLVRRFRVHEFDVEHVLAAFLPYHESPHFTKIASILHIKKTSPHAYLIPYQSAAQTLHRQALVKAMHDNTDLARFVAGLLPAAIKGGYYHNTLVIFNAATMHDFILDSKKIDEGTAAFVLPALVQPMQKGPQALSKDALLGSFVLLATLSHCTRLVPAAISVIVAAMANAATNVSTRQFVGSALAIVEAQEPLSSFSDSAVKAMLELPSIHHELRKATNWQGADKLLAPFLPYLVSYISNQNASTVLDAILTSRTCPQTVLHRAASLLLLATLSAKSEDHSAKHLRKVLFSMQQRHPSVVEEAAGEVSTQDGVKKKAVEQLVISLSVMLPTQAEDNADAAEVQADVILASTSSSKTTREAAVQQLIETVKSGNVVNAEYSASVRSALLARVSDSSAKVISALYAEPAQLVDIIGEQSASITFLASMSTALTSSQTKDAVILAHLSFLASHFNAAFPEHDAQILELLWPYLLFIDGERGELVKEVWKLLHTIDGGSLRELLGGCSEAMKAIAQAEGSDVSATHFAALNVVIANKISENILSSNTYAAHVEVLLAKLRSSESHTRCLAYLVSRALLGHLSGEHQIDAALHMFHAMELNHKALSRGDIEVDLEDRALAEAVVTDPTSQTTRHRLQASILSLMPSITRPSGVLLNWLSVPIDPKKPKTNLQDTRGLRYVQLLRTVYTCAAMSSSSPLGSHLLQTMFGDLGNDSLGFLAGVWTNAMPDPANSWLVLVALRHAFAFILAQLSTSHVVDDQAIVPAFLVAISSTNVKVRRAALECVGSLAKHSPRAKPKDIYGLDVIYGSLSDQLLYLDWDDHLKYIEALASNTEHLINDGDYLRTFHTDLLSKASGASKHQASFKQNIIAYLLSHVNALQIEHAQTVILSILDGVSHSAKALTLLPTIKRASNDDNPCSESVRALLVSCFDSSCVKSLNATDINIWHAYTIMLQTVVRDDPHSPSAQLLVQALCEQIFPHLQLDRQAVLCQLLLELGSDPQLSVACKNILVRLPMGPTLATRLLTSAYPSPDGTRAAKRAKLDSGAADEGTRVKYLVLLADVLSSTTLPNSPELIARLLDVLHSVVQHETSDQERIIYVQQLLMAAIDNAANSITEMPNVTPNAIRPDILVQIIRGADNPQIFNQALLLVANLSRLAPESMLHNIMPVFTFMGSNVLHRDDAYSFRLIQKTVESMVPVMVTSLKDRHEQRIDLLVAAKDLLRVFTDASQHIPKHRRSSFFLHLTIVLGPDDFLTPVCLLLIDKVSKRVVRQSTDEIKAVLALPISLLQESPHALQDKAFVEILHEAGHIVDQLRGTPTATAFLNAPSGSDDVASATVQRRRAQALILFVGQAITATTLPGKSRGPMSQANASQLVASLISLATARQGDSSLGLEELGHASRLTMKAFLGSLPVTEFVKSLLAIAKNGTPEMQTGVMELLGDRLHLVVEQMRMEISPQVIQIIGNIQTIMARKPSSDLLTSCCSALRAIGVTACDGEEQSMTGVVPALVDLIRTRSMTLPALEALSTFILRLGPRLIPIFRDIVNECVALLRETQQRQPDDIVTVVSSASSALQNLLNAMPTFWTEADLVAVIVLYTEVRDLPAFSHFTAFMRSAPKKLPSKTLLPAITKSWSSVSSKPIKNMDRTATYLEFARRCIRLAPQEEVVENTRTIFAVLLEIWEMKEAPTDHADEAEIESARVFVELTVKLNEATFKPLFRKMYDWAFTAASMARKATFYHVYDAVLDYFKDLMTPYMSYVLQPSVELLTVEELETDERISLWICVIHTLTKTFEADEGEFWRDEKLRALAKPLVQQVARCASTVPRAKPELSACLVAMANQVTDDALLKTVNLDLLMHTRSEDPRVRVYALVCAAKIWRSHGGKLLGFVSETATFIAECAEDENDMVVKECRNLKNAVESVAGNMNL